MIFAGIAGRIDRTLSQRNERSFMNYMNGWMNGAHGWMGGGMWLWTVIGVLLVVFLVVAISKVSKQ